MADQQRGDYPPTDQAYQVFDELAADLDRILKEMTNLCNQNIPNFCLVHSKEINHKKNSGLN